MRGRGTNVSQVYWVVGYDMNLSGCPDQATFVLKSHYSRAGTIQYTLFCLAVR